MTTLAERASSSSTAMRATVHMFEERLKHMLTGRGRAERSIHGVAACRAGIQAPWSGPN